MKKPWQIILADFYLDESKRINGQPRHFKTEVFEFEDKNEAIRNYVQTVNEWMDKCEDNYKNHGMAAWKMYSESDEGDILTNILFHFEGEEYYQLTDHEINEAIKEV